MIKKQRFNFVINQDSQAPINLKKLQDYKRGVRGCYRSKVNPDDLLFVTDDLYLASDPQDQQQFIFLLSKKFQNDVLSAKKVGEDEPYSFQYGNSNYLIDNRTRLDSANYINCGFDFENTSMIKTDNGMKFDTFTNKSSGQSTPLSKFIKNDFTCLADHITIINPDENNLIQDVNLQYAIAVIGSGCQDVQLAGDVQKISIGTNCQQIAIHQGCYNIKIGDESKKISIGSKTHDINIGNGCISVYIGKQSVNINIKDYCENILIGDNCGIMGGKFILGIMSGSDGGFILIGDNCGNQEGSNIQICNAENDEPLSGEFIRIESGLQFEEIHNSD